ncbi:MAG: hypothetical protein ACRCX8_17475 [Sarcina sp.]
MDERDIINTIIEEYEDSYTGNKVQGVGIVVDEKFKELLDKIIAKNDIFNSYSDVIQEAIYQGLYDIINYIDE